MRGILLTGLVALLSGCASWEPKLWVFPNLDLTVVSVSSDDLKNGVCSNGTHYDDGTRIYYNDNRIIVGCWQPSTRTIYVMSDRPEVLLHELCHADGAIPRDVCGRDYNWYEK